MDVPTSSSRARRWLTSGWLDVEFYEAVRGSTFSAAVDAAEDFVEHGMRNRLSPHPSVHFATLPTPARKAWRNGRIQLLLAHLGPEPPRSDPFTRDRLLAEAKRLRQEPVALLPVDWAEVAVRARRPGSTSVVVLADNPRPTIRTVMSILADGADTEVLVVDRGAPAHAALSLQEAFLSHTAVQVVRLPGDVTTAEAWDAGIARVSGENVLLLAPRVLVRRGALSALATALSDPSVAAVQPVLLDSHDNVASAGLVVVEAGAEPVPILSGHPGDDARRLEGERLAGISTEAIAVRVKDVATAAVAASDADERAARSLIPRLLELRPGGLRVEPGARVTSLRGPEEGDALVLPSLRPDPGLAERSGLVLGPDGRVVARREAHPGQRRWSIRLPSPPGALGDLWGDTHFGEALADAMRGLGEDVVTRRRGVTGEGPEHLDDVSLALRGLYPIPPVPGKVNVLWVFSHPDAVDPGELAGYDHVFAASESWSAALATRTGRRVVPLLQASRFEPPSDVPAPDPSGLGVVFVGSAGDGRRRPLVQVALEAGVPLAVYGRGWDDLPDGVWRGPYVDNHNLPDLYRTHGIVLADHWPDMARHGFIANRVFDAVASGARVLCDEVAGVHQVFDPRDVVVVRDRVELQQAFTELCRTERRDDVPRPSLTFVDRARALLAEVSRR